MTTRPPHIASTDLTNDDDHNDDDDDNDNDDGTQQATPMAKTLVVTVTLSVTSRFLITMPVGFISFDSIDTGLYH